MLRTALKPLPMAALSLATLTMLTGCPREQQQGSYGYQTPPPGGYQQPPPGYQQPPQPGYQPPPPQPGVPPQPGAPPPQPQPQPPGAWPFPFPPPPGTGGGQPGGTGGGPAGTTGPASPLDPAAAQVAVIPLTAFASQNLAGMQPVTDVVAGQFKQGQYLEAQFQMAQGKCYGAAAVGAGVSEMHIQIVALQPIPGIQNPVLAEDKTQGANASINCYKWTLPIGVNAKAVFIAQGGEGVAAGRVYAK